MSRFFDTYLSPQRVRNFQDGIYALLALSVSAAFILFLLGSIDILSSLTVIGVLLCLSLAGGTLRFLSMARNDNALLDQQNKMDQDIGLLQHRVNDHDLSFLKMAGQIETLETGLRTIRIRQEQSEKRQQDFIDGMKDRLLKLVSVLSRSRNKTPSPLKKQSASRAAKKSFFPPLPAVNVNMVPSARTPVKLESTDRFDDDVYVAPALLREAVTIAIKTNRIDTYIQPIVALPQQKAVAFDVYGRVRLQPGVYIPARQYRGSASHAGQQIALDHLVLRDAISLARQTSGCPLFINLTREGLAEAGTLSILARLIRNDSSMKSRLVINLAQRDLSRLDPKTEMIIHQLTDMGIKFGLNDVQTTDLDLNTVGRLKFSYLKLPHDKLVTTRDSDQGSALVHRFLTRLQTRGITAIAAQIETQDQLRPLLDYPIPLAEGYAFGRPDRPITYQQKRAA